MGEPRFEKRRCKRLKLKEQCTVQIEDHTMEVKLLELSPTGALIECENGVRFPEKEKLKLSVNPGNSEVILHFEGEVVYCNDNQVGIRFSPITA
jgi:c-di-GMP-binding flagellar brake protein YcgR